MTKSSLPGWPRTSAFGSLRLLCLLGSVFATTACSEPAPTEPPAPEPESTQLAPAERDEEPLNNVRWTAVREAARVQSFEGTGKLIAPPWARAEVTLPLPASVLAVHVAPGEAVEKGQSLLDVAMADAARAQGQLDGARLRITAYTARLKTLEELSRQGLARGGDLAEARARVAEAQAIAREAEAVLETVASAGVLRDGKHYRVVAPIAGLVVALDAPLGSTRGPGDGPLCVISGGAANRVEARFAFTLPQDVSYELWYQGQRLGALQLLSQAPEIRPNDATRAAWFELAEPTELAQGSAVRVRLRLPVDAWVVPINALRAGEPRGVRTRSHGVVPVRVLTSFGTEALVRGALREGDVVAEAEGS